ncbi:MAG: tyrosine-type recombinase/integrase [Waterburya sp.]
MSPVLAGRDDPVSLKLSKPIPLTVHPAVVYLNGLSEGSRPTMTRSLTAIAMMLTNGECDLYTIDWSKLRYKHTAAIQSALLKKYETTTAKKMMCALRRVLAEARKLELMDAANYQKAMDLQSIKVSQRLTGRALTGTEITALISVCMGDLSYQGIRDMALIAILRGTGLRRAEVVKLKLTDFDSQTGAVEVRSGKGGKDRTVYLPQTAIPFVIDWLRVRGKKPGALLCPVRKGGSIEYRHLSPQAVLLVMQKRAGQAGIKTFSPHDFRRTFCSDLLDAGVDIVTVQKLAGHASPITTAKYDRRGEETKRNAVQNLQF